MAKSWKVTEKRMTSRKESITLGSVNSYGYLTFELSDNGKKKRAKIHRLVAEHFLPKKEKCNIVNHKDGNKTNNNVSNLEWCTSQENNEHAYKCGLRKTKLTKEEVLKIRNMHGQGDKSIAILAKEFNTHYRNIQCIINRETWKHI